MALTHKHKQTPIWKRDFIIISFRLFDIAIYSKLIENFVVNAIRVAIGIVNTKSNQTEIGMRNECEEKKDINFN